MDECLIPDPVARNPFRSVVIRPGSRKFIFPDNECLSDLLARLKKGQWRGQIIGPHGTGKSTLLFELEQELRTRGHEIVRHTFVSGRPCKTNRDPTRNGYSQVVVNDVAPGEPTVPARRRRIVLVDGFEQCSWLVRYGWRWLTRRPLSGLIVTGHTDLGLPWLYQTSMNPQLAQRIIDDFAALLSHAPYAVDKRLAEISTDHFDLNARLNQHNGNLREVLFELYDVYAGISKPLESLH